MDGQTDGLMENTYYKVLFYDFWVTNLEVKRFDTVTQTAVDGNKHLSLYPSYLHNHIALQH